jgi:hypothetical protein
LYTLSPDSLYQPYIKFEPASRRQEVKFEAVLKGAIDSNFKRDPNFGNDVAYEFMTGVHIFGEQEYKLVGITDIYAVFEQIENRLFHLRVPILIDPFTMKAAVDKPGFVLPPDMKATIPGWQGKIHRIVVTSDPQKSVEDLSTLPHSPDDQKMVGDTVAKAIERVRLDDKQVAHAMRVVCAERGITCSRWGDFWRMLYFSAITISTVGYGDIVPLSGLTRFFAAFEATTGIILLGLFVNSFYNLSRLPSRAAVRDSDELKGG